MVIRKGILLGLGLLLIGAGACSEGNGVNEAEDVAPVGPATSESATPESDMADCDVRLQAVATAADLDLEVTSAAEVGGLPACHARVSASAAGVERVQVIDASASEWATNIGPMVKQLIGQFGAENDRKLEQGLALIEDQDLPDARACELFTTMVVTMQGAPEGARRIVNYLPDLTEPQAVNAQSCLEGRFRSVQLQGEIDATQEMADAVKAALKAVEAT